MLYVMVIIVQVCRNGGVRFETFPGGPGGAKCTLAAVVTEFSGLGRKARGVEVAVTRGLDQ